MKAKMAYFYSWTDEEIRSLSYKTFLDYWKAITVIEARDYLMQVQIGLHPWRKKEQRRKLINQLKKDSEVAGDKQQFSLAGLAQRLASRMKDG